MQIGAQERAYINKVLDSGRLSYGPLTKAFEEKFAKLHGCRYAIFCNSGTSALQVSLQALKEKYHWKDGSEVIVPALTFVATSNIVLHNRMKPVFVDVERNTYNIEPAKIYGKITKKTKAIIPVHIGGLPADMASIMAIANRYHLKVIEDSCETMFASQNGKSVGSFGDIGCFSTYMAHFIVTGIGGMMTTSDPDLAVRCRSLINHGRDSIYLEMDRRGEQVMERRFRFTSVGHSFRATEMEAALGLGQLERKDELIEQRQNLAIALTVELSGLPILVPYVPRDREHVFMFYPIVAEGHKPGLTRHLESFGIETRDLLPLINQPIYKKMFGGMAKKFPIANWLNKHAFYIGCHQEMTIEDAQYAGKVVRGYYANH